MPAPASRQCIRSRTDDRAGRRTRVARLRAGGMAVADIAAELRVLGASRVAGQPGEVSTPTQGLSSEEYSNSIFVRPEPYPAGRR